MFLYINITQITETSQNLNQCVFLCVHLITLVEQGSVYRKVNAVEEIQQTNKDDFWFQAQVTFYIYPQYLMCICHVIWCKMIKLASSEGWGIPPMGRDQASWAGETNVGEGEEGDRWDAGEGEGEESQGESSADRTGEVSQTTENNNNNLKMSDADFVFMALQDLPEAERRRGATERAAAAATGDFTEWFFFSPLKVAAFSSLVH